LGESGPAGSAIDLHLDIESVANVFYLLGSDIICLKNVIPVPVPVLSIAAFYSIGFDVAFVVKRFVLPVPVPVSVVVYGLLNVKPFHAKKRKIFIQACLPLHDAVEVLLKGVRVFVQHPAQLPRLRGEEDRDRADQPARASEGGAADGPGARHCCRHVVLAEEGRGLHLLGGQRDDLQLELEVAFGGGADCPAVGAADGFFLAALGQCFQKGAVFVWRSASFLNCDQLLLDAVKIRLKFKFKFIFFFWCAVKVTIHLAC
jgi:hypothetical protein